SNGRIFKVVYGDTKTTPVDLAKKSDEELATMVLRKNEWLSRHARRLLEERASTRKVDAQAVQKLRDFLGLDGRTLMAKMTADYHGVSSSEGQLRLLWAIHAIGGLGEADALALMKREDPQVRAWAIQLVLENGVPSDAVAKALAGLAREDKSPV